MSLCFSDLDGAKYGPLNYFQSTWPVQIAPEGVAGGTDGIRSLKSQGQSRPTDRHPALSSFRHWRDE
jgi:hypothetical protein